MKDTIIKAAARAIYVSSWSDEAERLGKDSWGPGAELMDEAPETSGEALQVARDLVARIERDNGVDLGTFVPPGLGADEWPDEDLCDTFGHYLGMEALGHGASWMEDHDDHGLTVPYVSVDLDFEDEDFND